MIPVFECKMLLQDSGAYKDIEIDILNEALAACESKTGTPYDYIEIHDGLVLAGFCLYYKVTTSDYTYDIHTFCIGQNYKYSGVASKLMEMLESKLLGKSPIAIIRVETSKMKEQAIGDDFYHSEGFKNIGHIPAFYNSNDDYYIYIKPLIKGAEEQDCATDAPSC